jgi:hypothetical protein
MCQEVLGMSSQPPPSLPLSDQADRLSGDIVKNRRVGYELTPCEPLPGPPFSACKPASPKRSYKDLFSSSERTYTDALLPHE